MKIKTEYTNKFINDNELDIMISKANDMLELVKRKVGPGNDFLGWLNLPYEYDKEEYSRVKAAATKIKAESDVLVVIGIGGSYLGAKAVLDLFNNEFSDSGCKVVFAGHNLSATYLEELLNVE